MPTLNWISAASDGSVVGLDATGDLFSCEMGPPWTPVTAPAVFTDIGVAFDGTVWGVSTPGKLWTLVSGQFQTQSCPYPIAQVSVGNAQFIWGRDALGNVYRYTGSSWGSAVSGKASSLAATADGFLWGLDLSGNVQSYDAATEQWMPAQPGPGEPIVSLSAGVSGWVWALGQSLKVYQYDGAQGDGGNSGWIPAPGTPPVTIKAVACGDDGTVWSLDASGNVYAFDFTAQNWSLSSSLSSATMVQLSAGDAEHTWGIDSSGLVYQYTANVPVWSQVAPSTGMTQVSAGSAQSIWALDAANAVWQSQAGLKAWSPVQCGTQKLLSVSAASDGSVWGIDTDGNAVQYSGNNSWTPVLKATGPLTQVSVGSEGVAWAVDADNNAYQFVAGFGFKILVNTKISSVSVGSDGSVFGVTAGSAVLYTGFNPLALWMTVGNNVAQIAAGSVNQVWIIDTSGNPIPVSQEGDPFTEGSSPYAQQVQQGRVVRFDTESVFDEAQSTHLWIVNRAAFLAQSGGPMGFMVYNMVMPWWKGGASGSAFHDQLCQGIYDADFVAPYNDPMQYTFGLRATWVSHFYDASTGENYYGNTTPTALSRGRALFWAAVEAFIAGDQATAGYNLGLSLHYFTDLCQPMHAANFTYFDSSPVWGYHTDFETAVMEQQSAVTIPSSFAPFGPAYEPGVLFINAAQISKQFFNWICPFNVFHVYKLPPTWDSGFLTSPSLTSAIQTILRNAVFLTAQYLVYWMTVTQGQDILCTFACMANGFVMDVKGGSSMSGAAVQQYNWNATSAQKFLLQPLSGADAGYYQIVAQSTTSRMLVLDTQNESTSPGAPIVQAAETGSDTQKWQIVENPGAGISFQNKASNLMITGNASGQPVALVQAPPTPSAAQNWLLGPTVPVTLQFIGGTQTLVLDIQNASGDAGTPLQVYPPHSTNAQSFLWVPLPEEEGYYMIMVLTGPMVLQAVGSGLVLNPWTGADSMKWKQIPGQFGSFYIQNKGTGQALSVATAQPNTLVTLTSSPTAVAAWNNYTASNSAISTAAS